MPTYDQYDAAMRQSTSQAKQAVMSLAGMAMPNYARQTKTATRETQLFVDGLKNLKRQHQETTRAAKQSEDQLKSLAAQAERLKTLRNVTIGAYAGMTGLAMGLVRSGLAGTVEGYRLEYAWTRLGRSLAAIALPAFERIADVIGDLAGWFEKLNGRQQDFIMKLGFVAIAAAPAIAALRMLRLVGAAAAGAMALGSSALGMGGAAAGAASAGAGSAVGGAALAAGGAAAGGGLLARGAGTAARLATRVVLPAAVAYEVASEAFDDDSRYNKARKRGRSMVGAAWESVTGNIVGESSLVGAAATSRMDSKSKEEEKKRRDPQAMGFAQQEAGGAHMRIQEMLLQVSVAKAEENAKAMQDEIDARIESIEVLRQFNERFKLGADIAPPTMGVAGIAGFLFDSDRLKKIMGK